MSVPQTQQELMRRAQALAGQSLAELATRHGTKLPENLRRAKGFIGQFIEQILGASAASKAEPDFPHLGIELKTIPIDIHAKPLESTFVTTVDLVRIRQDTWQESVVYKKLQHVLWIPIVVQGRGVGERRVGQPYLWQAQPEDAKRLAADWQAFADRIAMGQLASIDARHGHYLQMRPKGANAKALVWGIGETGHKTLTLPRGFYLRARFTQKILAEYFLV